MGLRVSSSVVVPHSSLQPDNRSSFAKTSSVLTASSSVQNNIRTLSELSAKRLISYLPLGVIEQLWLEWVQSLSHADKKRWFHNIIKNLKQILPTHNSNIHDTLPLRMYQVVCRHSASFIQRHSSSNISASYVVNNIPYGRSFENNHTHRMLWESSGVRMNSHSSSEACFNSESFLKMVEDWYFGHMNAYCQNGRENVYSRSSSSIITPNTGGSNTTIVDVPASLRSNCGTLFCDCVILDPDVLIAAARSAETVTSTCNDSILFRQAWIHYIKSHSTVISDTEHSDDEDKQNLRTEIVCLDAPSVQIDVPRKLCSMIEMYDDSNNPHNNHFVIILIPKDWYERLPQYQFFRIDVYRIRIFS